jgi:hypothetical protein
MTLKIYTSLLESIEQRLDKADEELAKHPVNEMGLLIRTPEALKAKKNFDTIYNQLKTLNKHTPNKIKKQHRMNKNGGCLYKTKETA